MASVFLSYDRDDLDFARPIAAALEKSGHSVWWDRHIKGGARYSKEIDKALKAADAVVVLWSERSVESDWVRDEATAGRDSGRFVPVRLDEAEPPLGFRQYQSVDLTEWKGRKTPQFMTLVDAVEALPGAPPDPSASAQRPRVFAATSNRSMLIAVLLIAAVALGALLLWRPFSPGSPTAVAAVVPGDSSAPSRDYAREVLAKLGGVRSTSAAPVELVSGSQAKRADLVFEVSGSTAAGQSRANIVLLKRSNGSVIWSKDFNRPAQQVGDLRQELSYTTAQVLNCAVDSLPRGRSILSSETLKLYLKGCADLSDARPEASADLVTTFRKVVAEAPKFEAAWSKLLIAEGNEYVTADNESGREQLKRDIAAARAVRPDLAAADLAEIDVLPLNAFAQRLQLADRAIASSPDNPLAFDRRSGLLFAVGRVDQALDDGQRAVTLDPLSPRLRESHISTLVSGGRMEAALQEMAKAERLWPNSSSIAAAKYNTHLRYGDPLVARQIIHSSTVPASLAKLESFLQARISPTPSNVDRALEDARDYFARDPKALVNLVLTLSIFHRDAELLALLMKAPLDADTWITDVTFRPAGRSFWDDPRSLAYAKRVGLLQYWRSSDKWPDFCLAPGLPYDCKKEAAKLLA